MRHLALFITLVAAVGCGGGTAKIDAPAATIDAGQPDADPNACASPGAAGNELGVGEYCTMGGGQCSDNTGALFCTADVGASPPFCTKPCAMTSQCGTNATCRGQGTADGGQMGCVPNCLP